MSIILPTVNGTTILEHDHLQREFMKGDLYDMGKPIHRQCTNVYKTKDGRWFHLHGSMNAAHTIGCHPRRGHRDLRGESGAVGFRDH